MMKKTILWGLIVAGHLALVAQAPKPSPGRYQLVAATVPPQIGTGDQQPEHALFLIDTESGRIWRFQSGGVIVQRQVDGKNATGVMPDTFYPVNIGPADVRFNGSAIPTKDRP